MQNKKTSLIVGFVIVAIIFFFAGNMYANRKNNSLQKQQLNNFAREINQGQRGGRGGNGNVFGKVLAKDANSITIELSGPGMGGQGINANTQTGSKIVFYTGTTSVMKSVTGSTADIAIGSNVSVQGTPNADGSLNADNVTIRPALPINASKTQ